MAKPRRLAEEGITLQVPGRDRLSLAHLVLDFTGTLSKDGRLLPGVAVRLRRLARLLRIVVATADTFGAAMKALNGLPVKVRLVRIGADKARLVNSLGRGRVAAIGNGRNDVPMCRRAAVSIAVIGPEGAAAELLRAGDVAVGDIRDALDLLLNPLRLAATLRP